MRERIEEVEILPPSDPHFRHPPIPRNYPPPALPSSGLTKYILRTICVIVALPLLGVIVLVGFAIIYRIGGWIYSVLEKPPTDSFMTEDMWAKFVWASIFGLILGAAIRLLRKL